MSEAGDRVRYIGNIAELHGMPGVVKGPGRCAGRCMVEWLNLGSVLDMSDTVLEMDKPEGNEMGSKRKTVVAHPDGTQSTRNSGTMIYTYAVESREDQHAVALSWREMAKDVRKEKARFIAAVRAGRISAKRESKFFTSVYLLGDGEEWFLGPDTVDSPLDRKEAVRKTLADFDGFISRYETDASAAEIGPKFKYGVIRWSQSHEAATKALREFQHLKNTTLRVVPAESAE